MIERTHIAASYKGNKLSIIVENCKYVLQNKCKPKKWFIEPFLIDMENVNLTKRCLFLVILTLSINFTKAQDKNFHTNIGIGIGPSIPLGGFKSKNITDLDNGFASKTSTGFKFIIEQNIGKRIGISLNFYSMHYEFDYLSFEKSLMINNRGLTPDNELKYEIQNTGSEWEVNVGNIGLYYYKNIGNNDKLFLKIIGSLTITDMFTPEMVINIKDSTNSTIEIRTIESVETWREAFFLRSPFDGFSLEMNAQYFFSKHFAIIPSVYYVNSIGWFEGNEKALINLSKINFQALNVMLGVSYTFFYKKV